LNSQTRDRSQQTVLQASYPKAIMVILYRKYKIRFVKTRLKLQSV